MLSSLKLSTQWWVEKILESWVALSEGEQCWKNSKLGVQAPWTLMENQFLQFLYSSASGNDGHLDGNMTSIYTANHSWEVPIFIELPFIVGLARSNRRLGVNTPQFKNGDLQTFCKLFCTQWNTGTTQITSLTMKDSRCQKPQRDQNWERSVWRPPILRQRGD